MNEKIFKKIGLVNRDKKKSEGEEFGGNKISYR